MGFKKATRENIWLKVLLAGSSGSGKTYTALKLGTGIARKMGTKLATIDTENGRIRYYASEFDFDDMQLEAPYTPEKYIEAIDDAIDGGYGILILDSITHEWNYCLEIHNKMPGNSYTNWSKITPRHDAFMEKILQSPIHVIATARGKDDYVLEEKNGKQVPKKVGLGYVQRDGIEFNYTATFNIEQDTHIACVTKDNTHLFEGRYDVLNEKDGEALYKWANEGDAVAPVVKKEEISKPTDYLEYDTKAVAEDKKISEITEPEIDLEALKLDITTKAKALNDENKKIFTKFIKDTLGYANYKKCEDVKKLQILFAKVKEL